jgi:hypothetical protein
MYILHAQSERYPDKRMELCKWLLRERKSLLRITHASHCLRIG